MKDVLDDTDILVILGYGIGEDDNHINAFLHEFLSKKDKSIIFVTEKEDREQVAKRLRLEKHFRDQIVCNCEKFQDANNQIIIKNIFEELEKMI